MLLCTPLLAPQEQLCPVESAALCTYQLPASVEGQRLQQVNVSSTPILSCTRSMAWKPVSPEALSLVRLDRVHPALHHINGLH